MAIKEKVFYKIGDKFKYTKKCNSVWILLPKAWKSNFIQMICIEYPDMIDNVGKRYGQGSYVCFSKKITSNELERILTSQGDLCSHSQYFIKIKNV